MSEPITQVQDHEGRLGRLEGIAEQLDRRLDALERGQAQGFTPLRQEIVEQGRRIDSLTRWGYASSQFISSRQFVSVDPLKIGLNALHR